MASIIPINLDLVSVGVISQNPFFQIGIKILLSLKETCVIVVSRYGFPKSKSTQRIIWITIIKCHITEIESFFTYFPESGRYMIKFIKSPNISVYLITPWTWMLECLQKNLRMASYRVGTLFRIQKLYETTGFTDGAAFKGYKICGRKAFWALDLEVLSYWILYFDMHK